MTSASADDALAVLSPMKGWSFEQLTAAIFKAFRDSAVVIVDNERYRAVGTVDANTKDAMRSLFSVTDMSVISCDYHEVYCDSNGLFSHWTEQRVVNPDTTYFHAQNKRTLAAIFVYLRTVHLYRWAIADQDARTVIGFTVFDASAFEGMFDALLVAGNTVGYEMKPPALRLVFE